MGRKRLPWIKLWLEFRTDPKMQRFSLAERGAIIGLFLLAAESPIRGTLMLSETEPMTIKDIGKALNIQPYEYRILRSIIDSCTNIGVLSVKDSAIVVTHFHERQDVNPSDEIDYHKAKNGKIRSGLTPGNNRIDAGNQENKLLKSQSQSQSQSQKEDNPLVAPPPDGGDASGAPEGSGMDRRVRRLIAVVEALSGGQGCNPGVAQHFDIWLKDYGEAQIAAGLAKAAERGLDKLLTPNYIEKCIASAGGQNVGTIFAPRRVQEPQRFDENGSPRTHTDEEYQRSINTRIGG